MARRGNDRLGTPVVEDLQVEKEMEGDLIRSYELGVNAYVQKPVDFQEFRNVIEELGTFWLVLNEPPPQALFGLRNISD